MTFGQQQPLLENSWQCSVQCNLWRLNSFYSLLRQKTGRLVDPLGFWWIELFFILKGKKRPYELKDNRHIFALWIYPHPNYLAGLDERRHVSTFFRLRFRTNNKFPAQEILRYI